MRKQAPTLSGRLRSRVPRSRPRHVSCTILGEPFLVFDCMPQAQVLTLLGRVRAVVPLDDLVELARAILQAAAQPGRCWACGCTEADACWLAPDVFCSWADNRRTLCTTCARRMGKLPARECESL